MKQFKIATAFTSLAMVVFLTSALAQNTASRQRSPQSVGNSNGGGGYVVKVNNSYLVLDLVEAGSDTDPFDPAITINPKILKQVQRSLHSFSDEAVKSVANKLTSIHAENPYLAYFLISAMQEYTWKLVNVPIVKLDDIGESNVDISKLEIYQGAVRTSSDITLNRQVLSKMNSINVAALVFHEIVYSMLRPEVEILPGTKALFEYKIKKQVNSDARKIVGAIYSKAVKYDGFLKVIDKADFDAKSWFTYLNYGPETGWLTKSGKAVALSIFEGKISKHGGLFAQSEYMLKELPQDLIGFCGSVMTEVDTSTAESSIHVGMTQTELRPRRTKAPHIMTEMSSYNNSINHRADFYFSYQLGAVSLHHSTFMSEFHRTGPTRKSLPKGAHTHLSMEIFRIKTPQDCVEYMKGLTPLRDPVEVLF